MKKVCCSAFCRSADGNKIWGSAYHFNEIYEIDLLSRKMKSLGRLMNEDNTFNLVESIECVGDKVLFIPGNNGKYFHVLDLKSNEQTNCKKNLFYKRKGENHVNRFFSFVWNNKIYVICRDHLSLYCFDEQKNDFNIVFEDIRQYTFRCGAFSLLNESVAFLSLQKNEVAVYNLLSNDMQYITLGEKISGVDRIAITEGRVILYNTEERKVYLLDRGGCLIESFSVSCETGNRIMMFSTEKMVYLIGITDWAQEIFQINDRGETVKLPLKNMKPANMYFLNRMGNDLFAYEFMTKAKNVDRLIYDAGKCLRYRLGDDVLETISWDTDGRVYENGVIAMMKEGGILPENEEYSLEFIFSNIDANRMQDDRGNHHISIGGNIHHMLQSRERDL